MQEGYIYINTLSPDESSITGLDNIENSNSITLQNRLKEKTKDRDRCEGKAAAEPDTQEHVLEIKKRFKSKKKTKSSFNTQNKTIQRPPKEPNP
jgi:hypothetical protein